MCKNSTHTIQTEKCIKLNLKKLKNEKTTDKQFIWPNLKYGKDCVLPF